MEFFTFVLVLCMAKSAYTQSFNVMDSGAVGDGKTDDSNAFTKAWEEVCGANSNTPTLNIPQGKTFLLKSLKFNGPCKSANVHVQLQGNIVASRDVKDWNMDGGKSWLAFVDVNGLIVNGNGQINGHGSIWWNCDDCKRPAALAFCNCNNIQVSGLRSINSPKKHISISNCANASLSHLQLFAPAKSPNTDGIDISHSENIHIYDSDIGTGDDCIAINTGSYHININGVTCGPGHGISIGSLGKDGEKASVENMRVQNYIFNGTGNRARIKTWQGGSGYARNILFQDITLIAADNPIIIDQFYCQHKTCNNKGSSVKVSDVSFIGFHGTTICDEAINFNCSQSNACTNIFLDHIKLTPAVAKKSVFSSCNNAHGKWDDSIPAVNCLSQ